MVLANDRGQSGASSRKDPCEVLFERVLDIAAAGTEHPDALSLHTAASQEQATIAHRAEQDGAGGRQISIRIEIFGDAYSMGPYCLVYIVVSIDIDAAHEVHELTGLRLAVTAHFVNIFADEMKRHICNYRVFQIRDSFTMKISNRVDFIDKALIIKQYPLNCHCGFEGMPRGSASWRAGLPRGAETPFGSTFVA